MDEVGYDKNRKKAEEDKRNITSDLDESELDLDNLKVEIGQDDQDVYARAERDRFIFNTEEELVASILDEIIQKVEDRFCEEDEKAEAEKALVRIRSFTKIFESVFTPKINFLTFSNSIFCLH